MYLQHSLDKKELEMSAAQRVPHLSHDLIVKAGEPKERPLDVAHPISPPLEITDPQQANVPQAFQLSNVGGLRNRTASCRNRFSQLRRTIQERIQAASRFCACLAKAIPRQSSHGSPTHCATRVFGNQQTTAHQHQHEVRRSP